MKQASKEDVQRIREEELRVVLSVVRHYPWKQLKASVKNFIRQCFKVWPNHFTRHPVIDTNVMDVLPKNGEGYFRSRQYLETRPLTGGGYLWSRQYLKTLPPISLVILQCMTVLAAAFICVIIGLKLRKRLPEKLFALSILIVIGLLGNNLITGVISMPHERFQSRIIWLVPMLSILFVLVWADDKQKNRDHGKTKIL